MCLRSCVCSCVCVRVCVRVCAPSQVKQLLLTNSSAADKQIKSRSPPACHAAHSLSKWRRLGKVKYGNSAKNAMQFWIKSKVSFLHAFTLFDQWSFQMASLDFKTVTAVKFGNIA